MSAAYKFLLAYIIWGSNLMGATPEVVEATRFLTVLQGRGGFVKCEQEEGLSFLRRFKYYIQSKKRYEFDFDDFIKAPPEEAESKRKDLEEYLRKYLIDKVSGKRLSVEKSKIVVGDLRNQMTLLLGNKEADPEQINDLQRRIDKSQFNIDYEEETIMELDTLLPSDISGFDMSALFEYYINRTYKFDPPIALKGSDLPSLKTFSYACATRLDEEHIKQSNWGTFARMLSHTLDSPPQNLAFLSQTANDTACVLGSNLGAVLNIPALREKLKDMIVQEDPEFIYFKFPEFTKMLPLPPELRKNRIYKVKKEIHQTSFLPIGQKAPRRAEQLSDYDLWLNMFAKAYYNFLIDAGLIQEGERSFKGSGEFFVGFDYSSLLGTYQIRGRVPYFFPQSAQPQMSVSSQPLMPNLPYMKADGEGNVYVTILKEQAPAYSQFDRMRESGNCRFISDEANPDNYAVIKVPLPKNGYLEGRKWTHTAYHQQALYFDTQHRQWMMYDCFGDQPQPLSLEEVNAIIGFPKPFNTYDRWKVTVADDSTWNTAFSQMLPLTVMIDP